MPLQEHPFPQRHCLFPRSAPEVNPGIFNQRRSFEQPFHGYPFLVCEPLVFQLECLAEDFQKFLYSIAGGLHGLSDFLYQFIGGRGIRRTLHVVLMGFAYIVENGVPCFVCHMAEKNLLPLSDQLPEFSGNGLRQLRDVLPVSLPGQQPAHC